MFKIIGDIFMVNGQAIEQAEMAAVVVDVPVLPEGAVCVEYDGSRITFSNGRDRKTKPYSWPQADAVIAAADQIIADVIALRAQRMGNI